MITAERVSVVIPLYNHQRYIQAALASVAAQSHPVDEIIIVDDGSSDQGGDLVQQQARQDSRILFWRQPNQGAHRALNAAIHRATGDYVAILNSDDVYHPHRVARCLDTLRQNPQSAAVCTGLGFINDQGRSITNPWYQQALDFYHRTGDLLLALINGNFIMTTSNLFIRRQMFEDIGFFCGLRYAHDLDFFLRLIGAGQRLHWLPEELLQYRSHASNTISEGVDKVKIEWAAVVAWHLAQAQTAADSTWLEALLRVTDRHNLTRLLYLLQLQLQRQPCADPAALLRLPGCRTLLEKVVQ